MKLLLLLPLCVQAAIYYCNSTPFNESTAYVVHCALYDENTTGFLVQSSNLDSTYDAAPNDNHIPCFESPCSMNTALRLSYKLYALPAFMLIVAYTLCKVRNHDILRI